MNPMFLTEHQPIHELYQWLYLTIICWSVIILLGGLFFDLYRHKSHEMPVIGLLCFGIAFCSFLPPVMSLLYGANVFLFASGHGTAGAIASAFTVFSYYGFIRMAFMSRKTSSMS